MIACFLTSLLFSTGGIAAQRPDTAAFIIRLGRDTTAIERFVRTAEGLEAVLAQRAPRTALRTLKLSMGPDGEPRVLEVRTLSSADLMSTPRIVSIARFAQDSIRIEETQADRITRRSIPAQRGAVALVGGFYSPYEMLLRRVNSDNVSLPAIFNLQPRTISIRRTGNEYAMVDQFDQPLSMRTDASGRLSAASGAGMSTVERVRSLDFEALVRDYAARDARGAGMGILSPLDSVRINIGGANIKVDYSRPGMRGRPIWGQLVPWNQVWRTGANQATHFSTDRPLQFRNLTVPPGTYTLFSIPSPDGWQLIFNKQTGQAGTEYDVARDLGRVPLTVSDLEPTDQVEFFKIEVAPQGAAGLLRFMWDRKMAFAEFQVLPASAR
jgi:hypothetical protein